MLKKTLAMILTITALLSLSSCSLFPPVETEEVVTFDVSAFTKVESEVDTTVDTTVVESSEEETTGEVIVITTDNAENTESSDVFDIDQYTEPPLTEHELTMAVPEFLDEDQQTLFRKATNVYAHLWGNYADLIEYEEALEQKIDKTKYTRFRDANGRVYTISRGLYKDWDNFTTLVHSVFTEEAFAKQNSNLYFVEHNGKLAFDDTIGRKNSKYNPYFEEEFELVSRTEDEVIFSITAYYSSWSALSLKELAKNTKYEWMEQREERLKEGWEWTENYTVRMVKTEDGWRFAEFHDAEIDAKEVTENKHYSFIGTYIWRYSSVEDALEDENTETIPRITFYEDGTCKMFFRLKNGACQFDGEYSVENLTELRVRLDLSGSEFDGFIPDVLEFEGVTDKVMLKSRGFSTVCNSDLFFRTSDEDLARLNITEMDSDEVNKGASPFVEGVDPLLTERVLKKAVPDFLNEEQQTLYRKAFSLLFYRSYPNERSMEFTDSLNYYVESKNYRKVFKDETDRLIYTISQGRYQNYDDFIELLHSVFTPDYAAEHFDYYNHNGKLTDIDASGVPSTYYSGYIKETFELISKTDDEIIFNIHVYPYWNYQYPEETKEEWEARQQLGWEWIKVATVHMINTEDGWRFDHFYDSAKEGNRFGPPLSKEDFDVPVPDFLSFEQQLIYRWAHNAYSHLWGGSPRLIEYPEFLNYTIDESKYKTVEAENGRTYTLARGYFKWHGYLYLIKTAFTEEEFNRQNKDLVYVFDDFSLLAFDDSVTREPSQYKLCSKDEFELVSRTEDEIVFKVIGHYAAADDAENKEILTKEFTIRMVRLKNNGIHTGWRFDEFHVTSIDG